VQEHFFKARERAVKKQQENETNIKKINIEKEDNDFIRREVNPRTGSCRNETENIIREIEGKRRLVYQTIESDIKRQQAKQQFNLSKSNEHFKSIRGIERRFGTYTKSINDSTSRVTGFIRRINDYIKEIIERFNPKEFFVNILKRQR